MLLMHSTGLAALAIHPLRLSAGVAAAATQPLSHWQSSWGHTLRPPPTLGEWLLRFSE